MHQRNHSLKQFKCDVCGKAFHQSCHLKRHQQSHLEGRPHICDVCGQGFKQRRYLERHKNNSWRKMTICMWFMWKKIQYIMWSKMNQCVVCGKEFLESCHPERHQQTHSERPLISGIIKGFKQLRFFKRHNKLTVCIIFMRKKYNISTCLKIRQRIYHSSHAQETKF